jgi:hypothetical protein
MELVGGSVVLKFCHYEERTQIESVTEPVLRTVFGTETVEAQRAGEGYIMTTSYCHVIELLYGVLDQRMDLLGILKSQTGTSDWILN